MRQRPCLWSDNEIYKQLEEMILGNEIYEKLKEVMRKHKTSKQASVLSFTKRTVAGLQPRRGSGLYKHLVDEPIHHIHVLIPATLNDAVTFTTRTIAGLQPERSSGSPAKVVDKGPCIFTSSLHESCSPMKANMIYQATGDDDQAS